MVAISLTLPEKIVRAIEKSLSAASPGPVILNEASPGPVILNEASPGPVILNEASPGPVILSAASPGPVILSAASPGPVILSAAKNPSSYSAQILRCAQNDRARLSTFKSP